MMWHVLWLGACMQDSQDAQPMQDLIPYFWNSGAAADGLHNRLSGVFWWAWNSNSGAALLGCLQADAWVPPSFLSPTTDVPPHGGAAHVEA